MTKNKFKKVYIKNVLVNKIFVSILTGTFVISSTFVHGLNTDTDSSILSNNELNLESIDNKSIEDIAQEDKILDEPKLQAIKSFAEPTEVMPQEPKLSSEIKDETLDSNSSNINKDQTNLPNSFKESQRDSTNQILSKSKKHVTGSNNQKINLTKYKYLLNAIDKKTLLVVLGVPTLIGSIIAIGKKVISKFVNKSSKNSGPQDSKTTDIKTKSNTPTILPTNTQLSPVSPITPMPEKKPVPITKPQKVPNSPETDPKTIINEVKSELNRLSEIKNKEKDSTTAERIQNESTFLSCMLGLYMFDIGVQLRPDEDWDNYSEWKKNIEGIVEILYLTIQKLSTNIATKNSIDKHLQNKTNWWATGENIETLNYSVPMGPDTGLPQPLTQRSWVELKPGSLLFCLDGLCLCCENFKWKHSVVEEHRFLNKCTINSSTCDLYYRWRRMMKTYSWTK